MDPITRHLLQTLKRLWMLVRSSLLRVGLLVLIFLPFSSANAGEDFKMAEDVPTENGDVHMDELAPNGHLDEQQTKRSREPSPIPSSFPTASSSTAMDYTPNEYSTQEDEGSVPPPAKRARTFSDADQASIVHVRVHFYRTPLLAC